ncbi:MAG: hypothetical protein K2J11_04165 [Oscillospiraceae bacterium]|nr:hypothetical protein [Oscillospiraceae bacterium]
MKRIYILMICAVVLLMSGCSQTAQQETAEANITENSTVPDTAEDLQTSEETTTALVTEDTAEAEATPDSSENSTFTEEEKQIQNLLQESHKIFYDYVLGKEMLNHVDWNKSITTPSTDYLGESYDMPLYEIVDGDVLSVADMQDKMRPFFTDKMIDFIFEGYNYYYYEENGKLYVSDGIGSDGGGAGVDTVHITSAETTDEDTLVLYMTEFGAGENWDLDHDIINNFTVTLKRTDNGFKIDECDEVAISILAWCYVPEDDIF